MKQHLNTLFVTTPGAYLAKHAGAVAVRVDDETRLQLPLINLGGIVCFGQVSCSPALMAACVEAGMTISFLSENGRFQAAVHGFSPGNVLLRRAQYRFADDSARTLAIARHMIAAKIANSRTVLLRAMRDYPAADGRPELERVTARMAACARQARDAVTLDGLRGIEGESASMYFGVFGHLITARNSGFTFTGRSRRPPLDATNALLSFLYAMLAHDARSACEACGLDAAVGYLHRDRPGRPGLALDLMEEFRPLIADRLALSLINRQQIKASGFRASEAGGVEMDEPTRKTVIAAYQNRKRDQITHPFLKEEVSLGLLAHLQARLLARHLRGDLDAYPAFLAK